MQGKKQIGNLFCAQVSCEGIRKQLGGCSAQLMQLTEYLSCSLGISSTTSLSYDKRDFGAAL